METKWRTVIEAEETGDTQYQQAPKSGTARINMLMPSSPNDRRVRPVLVVFDQARGIPIGSL